MEVLRTFIAFFLTNNLERTNAKQHISGNNYDYIPLKSVMLYYVVFNFNHVR